MAASSRIMSRVWARVSVGVASVRASMVRRARFQVTRRMMHGDEDGGDGVGELETGDMPVFAGVGCAEAEEHGERGPDVGAEVDGVGFEGFASGLARDVVELARAGEVDGDGEQKRDEGPDGEFEG